MSNSENKFTIYGRPGCGYCSAAINLCESGQFAFDYIDIWAEGITKEQLAEKTGKPVFTVPQIFHGDSHIGGYDDLSLYLTQLN